MRGTAPRVGPVQKGGGIHGAHGVAGHDGNRLAIFLRDHALRLQQSGDGASTTSVQSSDHDVLFGQKTDFGGEVMGFQEMGMGERRDGDQAIDVAEGDVGAGEGVLEGFLHEFGGGEVGAFGEGGHARADNAGGEGEAARHVWRGLPGTRIAVLYERGQEAYFG